ncbi:MAG: hypothetical protein EHM78_17310 [Myxococcaceae bacterium]|nr:MAG: hypothetical protein EHM78_17310 [Myxococcaceae bacterium]
MSRAVPGARTRRPPSLVGGLLLLASAAGCFKGEVGGLPEPPITHPDLACNTAPEARDNPECRLQLGVEKQEYVQQQNDKDWWVVNVGTLPARAIVHVVAGYKPGAGQDAGNFNTAVNFKINVLDSNNGVVGTSMAFAQDQHGSNPPKLLDLTFRYTKGSNDLYILVEDDNGRKYDNLSPYSVFVEVVPDPDSNESNDTPATATQIPLTPTPDGVQGSGGGFIATPGDADYFSINAPNPNSVMWIHVVQDCTTTCPPPHLYRLEYFLRNSTGTVVATDAAIVGSLVSDTLMEVGTARLLPSTGVYTLEVRGYVDPNNQTVIPPGDLNFKYKVEIIIVPLQDPKEPNNSIEDAKGKPSPDLTIAAGASGTFTGRISFVPDPDWYRVRLSGASATPHLLHYRVTPSTAPARFPPVPGRKDRHLNVTTEIPNGSQSECVAGDAGVCIISAPSSNYNYPIATNFCQQATPQCLQSARYENYDVPPKFPDLANFEGVLQVPPHAGDVDYFFQFEDEGTNWADDTDYTVFVQWLAEPEPVAEAIPEAQRPATMGAGVGATALTGYLSYGIGATDTSLGIAPITDVKDYDGRGDDVDTYAVDIPVGAVPEARLFWQWRIPSAGATPPYDLGIRLGFCVPDGGVDCASIQTRTQSGGSQLGLIYTEEDVTSWWNSPQVTPLEKAYDRSYSGTMPTGNVLTLLRDYACGCLEPRLIPASGTAKMFVSVFPTNRTSWDTGIPYTVETGFGAYPYSFTANGGGMVSCPTPCRFTLR